MYGAIVAVPLLTAVAVALEYSSALQQKGKLQNILDAAVLAAAAQEDEQLFAAMSFFQASLPDNVESSTSVPVAEFEIGKGVIDGTARVPFRSSIGQSLLNTKFDIEVKSQARFSLPDELPAPCITVLANESPAFLVNSGANVAAKSCEIHVHSQRDPSFTMNGGSKLDIARLCVKGNKYLHNGGTIGKLETGCDAAPDPFAGKVIEPSVPVTCATAGVKSGTTHTLNPGVHCDVTFHGTPTITFKPGLHIIKGPMILGENVTVIAEGVTFYFPDTYSKLQANGGLTMTASAPTSGQYRGILMFEKTSDSVNNANKQPFIFNGSKAEHLEGVVYLPNRDVTYNSTTNVEANKVSMVVNTMIINSANWNLEGSAFAGATAPRTVYLSR